MELVLSVREQSAMRRFLMAEPEPGALLPADAVDALVLLIGCDTFGLGESDATGFAFRLFELPGDDGVEPRQVCDGPVPCGIRQLVHERAVDPDMAGAFPGIADTLWSGFETPSHTVVQAFWDRRRSLFSDREVSLLRMVEPALSRLMLTPSRLGVHEELTPCERRVLSLVAAGASNREAAECLFVTVATVRKHLEHAYRKLGVTNRTAAVMALQPVPSGPSRH